MRTAIVSDIHANRTAFEAVLADLRETSPDLILHGGDLADGGPGGAEIVDRIRELGWPGVVGNTDEMLFRPESLAEFARYSPQLTMLWDAIAEMAAASREALGDERLDWLRALPGCQIQHGIALVHASPSSFWRAPAHTASDEELAAAYDRLGQPIAAYGHIHRPFVRRVGGIVVANSGSVGLSYDGDPRAAYLIVDGDAVTIRRVEYDVAREIQMLTASAFPHADWIAKMLTSASPQMP